MIALCVMQLHLMAARFCLRCNCIGCIFRFMKLGQWIKDRGLTSAQFAAAIGWSDSQISRVIRGRSKPSADLIREIFVHTEGAVTPADLVSAPSGDRVANLPVNGHQSNG